MVFSDVLNTVGGWWRGVVVTRCVKSTKVTLCRARIVLEWVTVYGQVNHLGTKPAS